MTMQDKKTMESCIESDVSPSCKRRPEGVFSDFRSPGLIDETKTELDSRIQLDSTAQLAGSQRVARN